MGRQTKRLPERQGVEILSPRGKESGDGGLLSRLGQRASDGIQRLRQVGDDIIDMLDAHRQPYIALGHAGIPLVLGCKLRMVFEAG